MGRLGAYALVLALAAAALGWALSLLYDSGKAAGAAEVQVRWDKAKADAEAETSRLRAEGYKLAADYVVQLRQLEGRYAQKSQRLRVALDAPAVCPSSGRLGDVVVPAAVVDGMFLRDDGGRADPPGPSASEPHRALR
jgi:hypothetical protein